MGRPYNRVTFGPCPRLAPRPLSDPRGHRRRRHGRDLSGAGHAVEPRRRNQGDRGRSGRLTRRARPDAFTEGEDLYQPLWRRSVRDFRRRSKVPDRRSGNWRSSLVIGQPCPQLWQHHVNTTRAVEIVCSGFTVPLAAHAGHLFGNRRNRDVDSAISSKFSRCFHGSTGASFNCGIIHTVASSVPAARWTFAGVLWSRCSHLKTVQPWSSVPSTGQPCC